MVCIDLAVFFVYGEALAPEDVGVHANANAGDGVSEGISVGGEGFGGYDVHFRGVEGVFDMLGACLCLWD